MAGLHLERIFQELAAAHASSAFRVPPSAFQSPIHAVHFIHRLGWVPVGEVSVYLRVLATHRAEALALCAAAIDRMKADVPIWKRTG